MVLARLVLSYVTDAAKCHQCNQKLVSAKRGREDERCCHFLAQNVLETIYRNFIVFTAWLRKDKQFSHGIQVTNFKFLWIHLLHKGWVVKPSWHFVFQSQQ